MKLGTNTEKAPVVKPKMNFPIRITGRFLKHVMAHPIIRMILVKYIAFSFPIFSAGCPAIIEPMAEPKAQIDVIMPFHKFVSCSVYHPKRY